MVYVVENNIMEHYLSLFRNEKSSSKETLESVEIITYYLMGRAADLIEMENKDIQTPLGIAMGSSMVDKIEIIPILRAGLAMLPPFQKAFPDAHIGFISLSRNKDLSINNYYERINQDLSNTTVFILDPMLATGNTALEVINMVEKRGAKKIVIVSILAAQLGINKILAKGNYPIVTMREDEGLDENYYLCPGVGDSGDRLYGKI